VSEVYVGDDLILWYASRILNTFASNFPSVIFEVGSGKWRPLWQISAYSVLKIFPSQDSTLVYSGVIFLYSMFVLIIILLTIKIFDLSKKWLAGIAFFFLFSPYFWYHKYQLFGIMEMGGFLFAYLTLIMQIRIYSNNRKNNKNYLILSTFTISAALFHERYLFLFGINFLLLFIEMVKTKKLNIRNKDYFTALFLLAYLSLRLSVVPNSFFVTGGENGTLTGINSWIFRTLNVSTASLTGWISGYDQSEIRYLINSQNNLAALSIFVAFSIIILTLRSYKLHKNIFEIQNVILINIFFGLISASLVRERVELRWLSYTIFIFIIWILIILRNEKKVLLRTILVITLISHLISIFNFGLINAHEHNFYNQQKKTMEELYKKINASPELKYDYTFFVIESDFMSLDWLTNYGIWFDVYSKRESMGQLLKFNGNDKISDLYNDYFPKSELALHIERKQAISLVKSLEIEVNEIWYLEQYPDVHNYESSPTEHFENFGIFEGRLPAENITEIDLKKIIITALKVKLGCERYFLDFTKMEVRNQISTCDSREIELVANEIR
jgi:hypothetical protein